MALRSAGILLYRLGDPGRNVFLVHPGGPYWKNKDKGAWSIPKGLIAPGEDPLAAARREFLEETGFSATGSAAFLGNFRQPGGKEILAWAMEGNADPALMRSNYFTMAWPPKSATLQKFPEVDRAAWFTRDEAMHHITKGQVPLLESFFARAG